MSITQNIQSFNNNYTSLQDIGNLPYHQGKTATSYDSVNSLTTHNNHYTLLYPDLVQKLFDLSLHKNNIHTNISHSYSGLSEGIDKSSSLNISLRPQDILFFLQIVSLYQLELSKGNSSITYPSLKLAKLLGVDASCDAESVLDDANMRATILKMTAKLESLGLLKVFRRKRSNGMDMVNKLIPVLPDRLYARIKDSPSNLKVSDSSKLDRESNLEHILRTKLFVPIELEFMKSLFKNNLPSKYKLFFLNSIMSSYRSFRQNSYSSNILSFSSTSPELMKKNNISRSTLDRIFRYVKQQGDSFFLKVEHKYTKSDDIDSNRYDKSIFVISINPLVFSISQIRRSQTEEISNFNCDKLQDDTLPIFPDTYEGFKTAWSKKQPIIIKKTALNNKEEIIKNKYNKNIDDIDENRKEEFFEEELCSSSSESYNNSSFLDVSNKSAVLEKNENQEVITVKPTNKAVLEKEAQQNEQQTTLHNKQKEEYKELRHFYPLSEKDISMLNSRANREFSNNFVNQLLLKLYIKYPEKRFKNRFTFLSYMVQILTNEKHQGPLVNHTTFRFSCNIGKEEKNLLEYEKYLSEIENSLDTSKDMCVKKKIAGRFSTEVSYKILTKAQFKTNHDNSFVTALIPNNLAAILSKRQIATLSEQLETVYGINGYYVEEVEKEMLPQKTTKDDITSDDKFTKNLASSNTSSAISEEILENTVWHQIRKGLREELGKSIDTVWFSKAVATECEDTQTLTIIMPTRFMSEFLKHNYSHAIRRLAGSVGVKMVKYEYEQNNRV